MLISLKSRLGSKEWNSSSISISSFSSARVQSWTKVADKLMKLSKIGFSMQCFTADFLQFFTKKISKFGFWLDGWVLAIKSKNFEDFLEIS